jgi:hypothetical protein
MGMLAAQFLAAEFAGFSVTLATDKLAQMAKRVIGTGFAVYIHIY